MPFFIKIVVFIFLLASFVCGQNASPRQKLEELRKLNAQIKRTQQQLEQMEEKQQEMLSDVLSVSESDEAEAARIGAKAVRLFPDGTLDEYIPTPDQLGFSVYSFTEISDYYFAPRIEYKNNSLVFIEDPQENGRHGFFLDVGGTLPETLGEQNREVAALAGYEPPREAKNVKNEFAAGGFTFRDQVSVTVGSTYLVRAITPKDGDGIFALKVQRKDADGSIVIFVKLIKAIVSATSANADSTNNSNKNQLAREDYETAQKIENALRQKGFTDVTVDGSTIPVILRGTIPNGKMMEVIKIALEIANQPVKNELTEQ